MYGRCCTGTATAGEPERHVTTTGSILLLLALVGGLVAVDRLFRRHFHQRGDRTVGARQRDPQTSWHRPTGEVIDELTGRRDEAESRTPDERR
jgi:hypothetical protein